MITTFKTGTYDRKKLWLLLFPLVFFTLQLFLKLDYKYFFMSVHDPAYGFLFNGLNLARGELGSGFAGFPGAPVQIFVALAIRLGKLFKDSTPLVENVLANPEYYLNIASYGIVLLITFALLISGIILYRHTKNLAISLGIQILPFLSITGMHFNSIVMCEPFLVISIQGILLQLAIYCFTENATFRVRQILYLSFFTALGITTKIVFIPVFMLPLVVIERWTDRFKFVLFTSLISAVFLIPNYPEFHLLTAWLKLIVFHKGIYGSGEPGIIDMNFFMSNLKQIFISDIFFTLITISIIGYLIFSYAARKKHKIQPKKFRILVGIIVVLGIQLIMIGKHYLPHYMITAYSIVMFSYLLLITTIKLPDFLKKYQSHFLVSLVLLSGIFLSIRFLQSFTFSPGLQNPHLKTVDYVNVNVAETQRIIVEESLSPFKEMGLYFGMAYSGKAQRHYQPILKKMYPDTYFYSTATKRYFDWNTDFSLVEILSHAKTTYLFRKSKTDSIPVELMDELMFYKKKGLIDEFTLAFKNSNVHDYLYKIDTDTSAMRKFYTVRETIQCNCETMNDDGNLFISPDGKHVFDKAYLNTSEVAFSGKYAVKLSPEFPYALDLKLKVDKNDYIKANVWRKSPDDKGLIILTDNAPDGIYRGGANVIENRNGWEKISLNYVIPESFQGNELHFYLWYHGKDSCYFDDFEVVVYSREHPQTVRKTMKNKQNNNKI